jgi:hypothetical protein
MLDAEFEELLARAATEGARRALANAGLDGAEAALDIRDLLSMLAFICFMRRTALHLVTTGLILALLVGIALKLKIFGGGP